METCPCSNCVNRPHLPRRSGRLFIASMAAYFAMLIGAGMGVVAVMS